MSSYNPIITLMICGFGIRAQQHIRAISTSSSFILSGIYDTSLAARQLAQQQGNEVFADLKLAFFSGTPDVVLISTPPSQRLGLITDILSYGRPRMLVIEKPLALNLEEAKRIVHLCEQQQIILKVAHQLPFTNEFSALLKTVKNGSIGDIFNIQGGCFGKVFDQGSHLVDLVLRLLPNDGLRWVGAYAYDSLSELAKLQPIPADFVRDRKHPGPLWTAAQVRMQSGIEVKLDFGILDACPRPELGPWLQKRLRVVGTHGYAEAHSASHFRILSARQTEEQLRTNIDEYEDALSGYYQDLTETILRPDREALARDSARNLLTVKLLAAIEYSGKVGRPLPFDGSEPQALSVVPATLKSDIELPGISVILPMEDHRGMGLDAVQSWVDGQRCDPDLFELIILLDRGTADLETELRAMLRSQDRLITREASNEMELYHYGASVARRQNLFFTEPHCIAEPEAIQEAQGFFERGIGDGFCVRSTPIARNAIGRLEARMYDEGFRVWSLPDHWGKVILRGFAISKKLYLEAGGFKYHYDRFAEWLLAAELKSRGVSLYYAPAVGVAHLYSDNFPLLDRFIKEFTDGECCYRLDQGGTAFCQNYFGVPPEWVEAIGYSAHYRHAKTRANWFGLWRLDWRSSVGERLNCLKSLLAELPTILLGHRFLLWAYRMNALRLKWTSLNPFIPVSRRYDHFARYWELTTAYCRVAVGLQHVSDENLSWSGESLVPGQTVSTSFKGFYPPESFGQQDFWWTSPFFGVMLGPVQQPADLKIRLCDFRGAEFPNPHAYLIHESCSEKVDVHFDRESLTLSTSIPALLHESAWLIFSVVRWTAANQDGKDTRALGLPVQSIQFNS